MGENEKYTATSESKTIRIGADFDEQVEEKEEPKTEQKTSTRTQQSQSSQQNREQKTQQSQNRNNQNTRPSGGGNNGSGNGGNDSNSHGGVFDNRLALSPTGAIFTVSTSQISNYFSKFFENYGYRGIRFANGRLRSGDKLPSMYLIFQKNERLIQQGKSPSDIEVELLGGRARGAHIKLDGKLFNLVKPFLDSDNKSVYEVKENRNYCYVVLDPSQVFFQLFYENRNFDVFIIDSIGESGTEILYRVGKVFKANNNSSEIEEIVQNISRS